MRWSFSREKHTMISNKHTWKLERNTQYPESLNAVNEQRQTAGTVMTTRFRE